MNIQELNQADLLAAKKTQQKKLIIGVITIVIVIAGFFIYRQYQNALASTVSGSIVADREIDSSKVSVPGPVDKSALYEAQEEKAKKDSMAKFDQPKQEVVMKMVSAPITAHIKESAKGPVADTKLKTSPPLVVKRVTPLGTNKKPLHFNGKRLNNGGEKKPAVVTDDDPDFNFVYNNKRPSGKTNTKSTIAKSNSPVEKATVSKPNASVDKTIAQNSPGEYGNYSAYKNTQNSVKSIQAITIAKQKIESGDAVGLKLSDDMKIGETTIPKGTMVYGKAQTSGKRVTVTISNIKYNDNLYKINYQVLGDDMVEGIPATIKNGGVDVSGTKSEITNTITSSLGLAGRLIGGVRSKNNNNNTPEYWIESNKKVYLTSN